MLTLPSYVLITPARNEAESIELTMESAVKQIVRPIKWIIASDGSTDGTDDIVRKYAADHPWIELVRTRAANDTLPERSRLLMLATRGRKVSTTTWLATLMPMFRLIRITFPTCFASWRKIAR
jgi:glycosyltransferase involved in cell wall biosynthesis